MPKVRLLQPLRGNDYTSSKKRELFHATHVALLWLAKHYPQAFPEEVKAVHPLAIGVREQLLDALSSAPDTAPSRPDTAILLRALGIWTKSIPYLNAAAKGRDRLNLDGTVATPISEAHRAYARRLLDERRARQKATPAPTPKPKPIAPQKASARPVLKLRKAS